MVKDKIITKICKCLRLSESANPNEAAAALRQALALMRKHNISQDQVLKPDIQEATASTKRKSIPYWLVALANLVAEGFLCRVYIARQQKAPEFVFIGHDVAPQIASYTFTVLSRILIRSRFKYMSELNAVEDHNMSNRELRRRGNIFAQAWLFRVAQTVKTFAASPQSQEAIDEYITENYGDVGDYTHQPDGTIPEDYDSILNGMRAAQNVSLYRPVKQAKTARKLEELV